MISFIKVSQQLIVMMAIISVGVYLEKTDKITEDVEEFIANITINIGLPALIFYSFMTDFRIELLGQYVLIPIFGTGVALLGTFLSYSSGKIMNIKDDLNELIFVSSYSNNITIGVPVLMALFGQQGVIMAILFDFGMTIILWTLGIWFLTKDNQRDQNALSNLITPYMLSLLTAITLSLLNISAPKIILDITSIIGGLTIPMAMFFIGIQLAQKEIKREMFNKKLFTVMGLRLLIIPLIVFFIVKALGLPPMISGVLVIEAGMPVVVTATVVMKKFNVKINFAAEAIFLSTIFISLTVPFFYWLVS
jgi:hypothetical protein